MLLRLNLLLVCLLIGQASFAQYTAVTVSGISKDKATKTALPYVNVVLKTEKDSTFVLGTISGDDGRFSLANVKPGKYVLQLSHTGYSTTNQAVYVGSLSAFLNLTVIDLTTSSQLLTEVTVAAQQDAIQGKLDKKTFTVDNNIAQLGGSVLQAMQNLPGITIQEGKVQLRAAIKWLS
jgi:hypothetical protein